MRINKFVLFGFTTVVVIGLQLVWLNFPVTFAESVVVAQAPDTRKTEADKLFQQGIKLFKISQIEAASQSWQQALIIYREIKDSQGEGQSLGNLGIAYNHLGDYAKAIDFQQQSLAIKREIKNRKGEGRSLGNLGLAYHALGDYAKAIDYHEQSLAVAREIKDRLGEGNSLGNLGLAYENLGDYAKAIEYHEQSLAIAREIKDPQGEGNSLGNLGNAYHALGDYAKAIDYHEQSLAIAREIKDRLGESNSLGNLGLAYYALGDYLKAIDYHEQSLAIAREIKDSRGEGQSLGNLGNVYYALGDYLKAIDYHKQSLAIKREIKDSKGEGNSLGNLGLAYENLGDYAKAIDFQQQSLAIAREIKDRLGEGNYLGNLGLAYYALGDYLKAIDYHEQSLAIAREIKYRLGEGNSLGNLGNAYRDLGDYAKAITYHEQSLAIKREIKDFSGEGISLNNLGVALYESGNLPEAEKTLRAGIEVWESIRGTLGKNDSYKVSIFEQQARTYSTLQKVLIAENKTNDALETSERGRARAFVELLTSRARSKNTGQTLEPTVTKPTLSLLRQIAKQHSSTFVEYSVITDEFKIQGKQKIKDSLLYIWVIKPTGEVTFRKSDLKPLWQKENTTLEGLVTRMYDDDITDARGRGNVLVSNNPETRKVKKPLKYLHELLIKPIADLLPSNESDRIVFIPQKSLFLVPFPALQDEQGKFLIEKHTILTSPSIQVLDLTHKQRQKLAENQNYQFLRNLVLGNPTMPMVLNEPGLPPQQLEPLPGAEQEAKNIAQILKTKAIIGNEGTKSAIVQKMPSARIIHLATHGIFDDIQGLGSGIALAPDSGFIPKPGEVNGLLTAEEILDLKLQAELVVLSACNTGNGKITGDGVIGLSRSLISAGVPSVLVSLWSVPDSPTTQLMSQFYENLQQRMNKAQALRQAMLATWQTNPRPVDWAAFTLIGEAN